MASVGSLPDVSFVTGGSDLDAVRAEITAFVAGYVERSEADGVVVPMSGGIDSTLAATLCAEALGAENVLGLTLPNGGAAADGTADATGSATTTATADATTDAEAVAASLGIEHRTVDLAPLLDAFEDLVAPEVSTETDRVVAGNALARLRMTCAYYAANARGYLVCGTANRSEHLLGYFTKHGDGAADIFPLAELYKTEVRALARRVGVPTRIVERTPTAGFWHGQTDRDELGAPYGLVDVVLHKLVDEDLGVDGTAAELGVDREVVERFARMHAESRHKRHRPPTPDDAPPDAEYFHELELRY